MLHHARDAEGTVKEQSGVDVLNCVFVWWESFIEVCMRDGKRNAGVITRFNQYPPEVFCMVSILDRIVIGWDALLLLFGKVWVKERAVQGYQPHQISRRPLQWSLWRVWGQGVISNFFFSFNPNTLLFVAQWVDSPPCPLANPPHSPVNPPRPPVNFSSPAPLPMLLVAEGIHIIFSHNFSSF